MFANNGRDGTKGSVVGDNQGNTFWFVQCGSVMGRKCFCPCDIVVACIEKMTTGIYAPPDMV